MNNFLVIVFLLLGIKSLAQPRILEHAIITTNTSMTMPEDMNPTSGGPVGGEQMVVINGMAAGEDNKIITWYKNDIVKIVTDMGMGRNTLIIDNKNKRTTTLIEAMGTRTGFYTTEEDEKEMKRRMDSLTGARKDSITDVVIDYLNETKKIAGYECKKALIKTIHGNGKTDTQYVWYSPEFKMGPGFSFRTGMMGSGILQGFDKLNGFPMKYETKMRRGITMSMEVVKIDTEKNIDNKEFEIPKDFILKPMKDMQGSGGPGTIQIRIGGHQ